MSVFLIDLRYTPQFQKMAKDIFRNFPFNDIEVTHLARSQSVIEAANRGFTLRSTALKPIDGASTPAGVHRSSTCK